MKVLLHCCCAPCVISCVSAFKAEGIEPITFWYNPNIHPFTEYKNRRDCFFDYVKSENINIEILNTKNDYGLKTFLNEIYPDTENRCEKCYRMRLEKTAFLAAEKGYSFSTSLLISPYQDHEKIRLVGEEEASKYKIQFLYRDFRPLFHEGQSAARARGFYMQKYCGCIFSEEERYQNI